MLNPSRGRSIQWSLTRGGSTPRSNTLFLHKLFFTQKASLSIWMINGTPESFANFCKCTICLYVNISLNQEVFPILSYTWNLKRYSFLMRPHRLGHYREFFLWVLNSMKIKREVQKRLQRWSWQLVFDTRLQLVSYLLKYSFLRVERDVYHACGGKAADAVNDGIRHATLHPRRGLWVQYNTIQSNPIQSIY